MSYFEAKSDLEFTHEFSIAAVELLTIEAEAAKRVNTGPPRFLTLTEQREAVRAEASKQQDYGLLRAQVARRVPRAKRIQDRLGFQNTFESYPMPAVGGPVIKVALFDAILYDPTYGGIPPRLIVDALNQLLGACEERVEVERRQLINPLYWVKEALAFFFRIPFMIAKASGFDVGKFEDQCLGRLVQLIWVVFVIGLLLLFGLSRDEIRQAILVLITG